MKCSLSELQEIALYAKTLSVYKVLGFQTDMQLLTLSKKVTQFIDYNIEDDLREVNKLIAAKEEELTGALASEYFTLSAEEQEKLRETFNVKISRVLNRDEGIKDLTSKRDLLWDAQVEYPMMPSIEIPFLDYDTRFVEEKTVHFNKKDYKVDGYLALMELISRGILIVK